MQIRYLNESDDRRSVSHIYEESWKYAYRGIVPQSYLDNLSEGSWVKALDSPDWSSLVLIDEEGQLAGTSSFCRSRFPTYPDDGEIISIYLLPQAMGRGWGAALLKRAMEELAKRGFDRVFLWVLEENTHARAFYARMGFENSGTYMDSEIGGKLLRELRYVRELGRQP